MPMKWLCEQWDKARAKAPHAHVQPAVTLEMLLKRSAGLPYRFPTKDNLLSSRMSDHLHPHPQLLPAAVGVEMEIEGLASRTRPIIHARMLPLLEKFIASKTASGSAPERRIYEGLSPCGLVDRLVAKRPLVFMNPSDTFCLRSGEDGAGGFEQIGTEGEAPPLILENLQSYDEMMLSSLMGVSSPTLFINDGSRGNQGKATPGGHEKSGVYVGLVGSRFERPRQMEWKHMIVEAEQNTEANGYGAGCSDELAKSWADFYGIDHFPTFEEANSIVAAERASGNLKTRFVELKRGFTKRYLDTLVVKARARTSAELFLMECDQRAGEAGKKAFAHIVGLGLGVWAVDQIQKHILVEAYAEAMHALKLENVAHVNFSWFSGVTECGSAHHGELFEAENGNKIHIYFNRREPAQPLGQTVRSGDVENLLLVAMFAWDGNAFPGNEYWCGAL